jgi:hypothetical protein
MRHARRLHLGRWALAHFTAFPAAVGAASGLEEGDKNSQHGYYAFIEVLPKAPASECEQIAFPGHKAVGLAGDQINADATAEQIAAFLASFLGRQRCGKTDFGQRPFGADAVPKKPCRKRPSQ